MLLLLVMLCFIFRPRQTKNLRPKKASSGWCYFTSVASLLSRQHCYQTSFQLLYWKECKVFWISLVQLEPVNLQILCKWHLSWPSIKTSPVSDQLRYWFGSCQRSLRPICFRVTLLPRRLPVSKSRLIQWNYLLFFLRGIKFLLNKSFQVRSKLHLRMSWTSPTLIRPRERLQLLALVLCTPWWTSPVFASTWTQSQSSPLSVPMMSLSRSFVKSFSTLLL